ncbi:MAG: ABC transporter ATP-binding protein [Acidimicrobiales bacterium]|nr:ABC transporter ATP-binding protein [Acidimicrobiales bacterium]
MSPATIHFDEASKHFGDLVAVSEVSFRIGGGVTALLGPNGAGKSTVLRMMCGMIAPTLGRVRVLDRDPRRETSLAGDIGLVSQHDGLFDRQRALEFVALAATLQGIADPTAAAAAALETVELDPADRRVLGTYSKGMRQRVKLAQALVHDPRVLILDEPLTGLDPRQRSHMIELFHRLGDEGRCVVVSSHVLDEVERIGSRILVIAQGRLAAEGDFRAIRALMDDRPHRIRLRSDHPRELAGALLAAGAAMAVRLDGADGVMVETTDIVTFRTSVATLARRSDARLYELVGLDDDLESVFRYLVGGR